MRMNIIFIIIRMNYKVCRWITRKLRKYLVKTFDRTFNIYLDAERHIF